MKKEEIKFKHIKDLPLKLTDWIGSVWSLVFHTLFFAAMFALYLFNIEFNTILLVLTTLVSLEAIYLAIFIQMTVNRNTQSLVEVEENIDEIAEDVEGMEKDIDEIQEDIDKLEEDESEPDTVKVLTGIEERLQSLISDIETLKNQQK